MMRISRAPAADQARLLGHRLHMLAVANASVCWQNQSAFVYTRGSAPLATVGRTVRLVWEFRYCLSCDARQPRGESLFNPASIGTQDIVAAMAAITTAVNNGES